MSSPVTTVLLGARRWAREGQSFQSHLATAIRTWRLRRDAAGSRAGRAATAPDVLAEMAQAALVSLNRLPDEERQVLAGTLRAWVACDGSTEATAKALCCHPATVRYRLNQALQRIL